jgi:hypothetical protein
VEDVGFDEARTFVTTTRVFGAAPLVRFEQSEFQNQAALGLLVGARLGEAG